MPPKRTTPSKTAAEPAAVAKPRPAVPFAVVEIMDAKSRAAPIAAASLVTDGRGGRIAAKPATAVDVKTGTPTAAIDVKSGGGISAAETLRSLADFDDDPRVSRRNVNGVGLAKLMADGGGGKLWPCNREIDVLRAGHLKVFVDNMLEADDVYSIRDHFTICMLNRSAVLIEGQHRWKAIESMPDPSRARVRCVLTIIKCASDADVNREFQMLHLGQAVSPIYYENTSRDLAVAFFARLEHEFPGKTKGAGGIIGNSAKTVRPRIRRIEQMVKLSAVPGFMSGAIANTLTADGLIISATNQNKIAKSKTTWTDDQRKTADSLGGFYLGFETNWAAMVVDDAINTANNLAQAALQIEGDGAEPSPEDDA